MKKSIFAILVLTILISACGGPGEITGQTTLDPPETAEEEPASVQTQPEQETTAKADEPCTTKDCIIKEAKSSDDPTKCAKLSGDEVVECLYEIRADDTTSELERLCLNYAPDMEQCFYKFAVMANKVKLCESAGENAIKCLKEVKPDHSIQEEIDMCNALPVADSRTECVYDMIGREKSYDVCDRYIKGGVTKCYAKVAVESDESESMCDEQFGEDDKANCLKHYAAFSDDRAICRDISGSVRIKEECYEHFDGPKVHFIT
ncbi:hypothetical protein ACFL0W_03535 [Nanoarchaeota archaeon]